MELIMLKAALNKYADKMKAAITALRTVGEDKMAAKQEKDLEALVGKVGDRDGTTIAKLDKLIDGLEHDACTTLSSTKAEVRAYDVGLPLQERRLRTMEGELRSIGRPDVADWCVEQANFIGSELKDHYGDQLPLKDKGAGAANPTQPDLVKS